MTYDGQILAKARDKLDGIRARNEAERTQRIEQAYAREPEIRDCDEKLRAQVAELLRLSFSREDGAAEKIENLRMENLETQQRRRTLLSRMGHGEEWLDEIVSCNKCRDTGIYNGGVCDCLKRMYNEAMTDTLAVLLKNGDECFEKFDLSLYGEKRETMKKVFTAAKAFAERFPEGPNNLLFQGGTGLGKTFLSACVARAVAGKGFSVCYDSITAIIGSFEAQKFDRDEEADKRVKRILDCNLLILDDLGTEMPTPFADSTLYTLINSRLAGEKKTIISTNLTFEQMEKRYSPAILSRLRGSYELLPFVGRDIRLIKR